MQVGLFQAYSNMNKQKKSAYPSEIIDFKARTLTPKLPTILYPTPPILDPGNLGGVSRRIIEALTNVANKTGQNMTQLLEAEIPWLKYRVTGVEPEKSITVRVGRTNVTSAIDAKQLFEKAIELIDSAQKSLQIEMFEFQNMHVDGHIWPSKGAQMAEGWELQQLILKKLIVKKLENPAIPIQMILDTHKWCQDGYGLKRKFYNNLEMIEFLKDLKNPQAQRSDRTREILTALRFDEKYNYKGSIDIDVVPYPQQQHGGAVLQHIKGIFVDGKKCLIMGMNCGNHSPANHDVGVVIETAAGYENSEVDNIIHEIFTKDFLLCWERIGKTIFEPRPLTKQERHEGYIKIVNGPVNAGEQKSYNGANRIIKSENVEFARVMREIYDKPEYKNRFIEQNIDLVPVNPIENPAIKILVNRPRIGKTNVDLESSIPDEYKGIFSDFVTGKETIGEYFRQKIETCEKFRGAFFAFTHKEFINKIIQKYHESLKPGGEPFDPKMTVSPDIIDSFPYTRVMHRLLIKAGIPVREYAVNEDIEQRMHAKLSAFYDKNPDVLPEIAIGSANASAQGLEQNTSTGFRDDYALTNQFWDKEIMEKKEYGNITKFEEYLGLKSLYTKNKDGIEKFNYPGMLERKHKINAIKLQIDKLFNGVTQVEIKDVRDSELITIKYSEENEKAIKTLLNLYRSAIKGFKVEGDEKIIPPENERVPVNDTDLKKQISTIEGNFGLKSLHDGTSFDYIDMQQRMDMLKPVLKAMKPVNKDAVSVEGIDIALTKENGIVINKLVGYYEEIQKINNRRNKFHRGNNECVVIIPSKELSDLFSRQIERDHEYSKPRVPEGYGHNQNNAPQEPSFKGNIRILSSKSTNPFAVKPKANVFSRMNLSEACYGLFIKPSSRTCFGISKDMEMLKQVQHDVAEWRGIC